MTGTKTAPAAEICQAFFDAMDLDKDGVITGMEAKAISVGAFGETVDAANKRWAKMLADMDKNNDGKISRDEYVEWWMKETASKLGADGAFSPGYGEFLSCHLEKLNQVAKHAQDLAKAPATELCQSFFDAMDVDKDGFISKDECTSIAKKAFGETEEAAEKRWSSMLADMDHNDDGKISRDEYVQWWMKQTSSKMNADGTFNAGYGQFLMMMLSKMTAIAEA